MRYLAMFWLLSFAWMPFGVSAQGLLLDNSTQTQSQPFGSSSYTGPLPAEVDLSPNRIPRAGNQGKQASCVAWAVAYAARTYYEAVEKEQSPDGDDVIFSPAYVFNRIKEQPSCFEGGAYFSRALEFVKQEGVATLKDFPYDENSCDTLPSEAIRTSAGKYRISDYFKLQDPNDPNVIKGYLASGDVVLIGVLIDQRFRQWEGRSVYSNATSRGNGHAMVVVGYSDKMQAFRVMNSYGDDWGDGGYVWMSYELFRDPKIMAEAWVARDVSTILGGSVRYEPNLNVEIIDLQQNALIDNAKPGIRLVVRLSGQNIFKRSVSVVARFWHEGNQYAVVAATGQKIYVDAKGQVAVGLDNIGSNDGANIDRTVHLDIPYEAINVPLTVNHNTRYQLEVLATAYLDRLPLAKSNPMPIAVIR